MSKPKPNDERAIKVSDFCDPSEAETYMRICGVENVESEMEEYRAFIEVVRRIENGEDVEPDVLEIVKALHAAAINMKALADPIDPSVTLTVVSAVKSCVPRVKKIIIISEDDTAIEVHVTKPTDVITLYMVDRDGNRLWFTKALNAYGGASRNIIL